MYLPVLIMFIIIILIIIVIIIYIVVHFSYVCDVKPNINNFETYVCNPFLLWNYVCACLCVCVAYWL